MDLTCPRCSASFDGTYYGPCPDCRAALRTSMRRDARNVERTAFEPAMHVTPNAVALKE
jgi:predicted amidophosphoribosyltransferase